MHTSLFLSRSLTKCYGNIMCERQTHKNRKTQTTLTETQRNERARSESRAGLVQGSTVRRKARRKERSYHIRAIVIVRFVNPASKNANM